MERDAEAALVVEAVGVVSWVATSRLSRLSRRLRARDDVRDDGLGEGSRDGVAEEANECWLSMLRMP